MLVVEDNNDTRDMVKMMLEESGASVTSAASVNEAKKCLQQSSFDVLVSDIAMPEANGYELIRYLRSKEVKLGGNIPAIALTAFARPEDRMQALTEGFQMHIAKPVEPTELILAVAQLVGIVKNVQVVY